MTEKQLLKNIIRILKKHLDLKNTKVFIFGSRATGTNRPGSDFDIGIKNKEPIPYAKMALISDEVDRLDTLYTVQIVDFNKVTKDFKEVALSKIKIIYPPDGSKSPKTKR